MKQSPRERARNFLCALESRSLAPLLFKSFYRGNENSQSHKVQEWGEEEKGGCWEGEGLGRKDGGVQVGFGGSGEVWEFRRGLRGSGGIWGVQEGFGGFRRGLGVSGGVMGFWRGLGAQEQGRLQLG